MTKQIEAVQSQTQEWQNVTVSKLEQKHQELEQLTNNLRDMKMEIQKICEAITMKTLEKSNLNQLIEENTLTPHTQRNSSTMDESFNNDQPDRQHQTTTTIIIPPSSSIPTFSGSIMENPRQFLIRVKEYAETINHWNDQHLLKGISQFLRNTALEWYCQLGISNRRPQTWTEFKVIFLNQFNSPIRRAHQEQQWKSCKQEENETINEFIVRLRALWQEQKPNETESDLIRHLMCKMRNNLLTMIGISRCESLDEIILEAQKIEEILYQRNKQRQRTDYDDVVHNDTPTTTMYKNENHYEVQTISAHQMNRQTEFNNRRNLASNKNTNDYMTPRQSHQSTRATINQQSGYPSNEAKCYMCGQKGHFRRNCPYQYNTYQHRNSWHYSKNDNGAHGGRVHGAPM
ncbi:unnamed protein product [Rotaria sordida]|uniref:CCHC-type domain-containing protein n=1 Tax=Rotaria sordida TaxID=392033 RepID=A0A815QNV5_9BILA|nr:unnamed protein product [Rotaria sordida]CAF1643480.1 unnamed protein product [Rotaria sordida]